MMPTSNVLYILRPMVNYAITLTPRLTSLSPCYTIPTTPSKELMEDKILEKCRTLYPDVGRIMNVLSRWVHHGRENKIDKPLINALLFLDHDLAISVLRQL